MPDQKPDEIEIFAAAAEMPVDEQADFLDEACQGDAELRARLASYLRCERESGPLDAAKPRLDVTLQQPPPLASVGSAIGPYKLVEIIGEGGMGLVYMAEQKEPVRRMVALKVIKPGMDSKQVVARFESERQALALMNHPNIAKVLDAGTTDTGLPYFVMELVRGIPITDYCDQHKLTTQQRLELFATVCHAVQHAHQKGVIHRDIKPSNVLAELHDISPVPKVIDFGVAKAINQQLTDRSLHTGFAQLVGTPLYMSPEQAQLSGLDVDTRSDVFSLGVLLYELLTGATPFDKETLRQVSYDEMRRMIREDDPRRPSERVSTMAAEAISTISDHRRIKPRALAQSLRGDLDWVVMKALEKDRTRRYETAKDFAADVHRYLDGEAVEAHPPSRIYELQKFIAKHKGFCLAGASIVAALLLGIAGTSLGLFRAESFRRDADHRANQLARQAEELRVTNAELETLSRQQAKLLWEATDIAGTLSNIGILALAGDDPDRALVYTRQAVRLLENVARQQPGNETAHRFHINTQSNLGHAYYEMGQFENSIASFGKAIESMEQREGKTPADPERMLFLATLYKYRGKSLEGGKQVDTALEHYERAAELFARVASTLSDDSKNPFRELLEWMISCYMRARRGPDALRCMDQLAALSENGRLPPQPETLRHLLRAYVTALQQDYREAVRIADQYWLDPNTRSANVWIGVWGFAAEAYSLSAKAVADDQRRSHQERENWSNEYGERAVEVLRFMLASPEYASSQARRRLLEDDDYAALRDRADFQELLRPDQAPIQ